MLHDPISTGSATLAHIQQTQRPCYNKQVSLHSIHATGLKIKVLLIIFFKSPKLPNNVKKSTWQIKWWERQETHVNTQVFQLSTWQFHSINRQKITAHLHKMHVHHVLKHFNCPSDSKTLSASVQLPYSENCMNDSYEWLLLTVQSKLNMLMSTKLDPTGCV